MAGNAAPGGSGPATVGADQLTPFHSSSEYGVTPSGRSPPNNTTTSRLASKATPSTPTNPPRGTKSTTRHCTWPTLVPASSPIPATAPTAQRILSPMSLLSGKRRARTIPDRLNCRRLDQQEYSKGPTGQNRTGAHSDFTTGPTAAQYCAPDSPAAMRIPLVLAASCAAILPAQNGPFAAEPRWPDRWEPPPRCDTCGFGSGSSFVHTLAAESLRAGHFGGGLRFDWQEFDAFSDAQLLQFSAQGIGAHSIDRSLVLRAGAAYGV